MFNVFSFAIWQHDVKNLTCSSARWNTLGCLLRRFFALLTASQFDRQPFNFWLAFFYFTYFIFYIIVRASLNLYNFDYALIEVAEFKSWGLDIDIFSDISLFYTVIFTEMICNPHPSFFFLFFCNSFSYILFVYWKKIVKSVWISRSQATAWINRSNY